MCTTGPVSKELGANRLPRCPMSTERDSLGEVRVPDDVYYGPQTQRARENFPVSGRGVPPALVHALGAIKAAAASANAALRLLSADLANAIAAAADEVAQGKQDD